MVSSFCNIKSVTALITEHFLRITYITTKDPAKKLAELASFQWLWKELHSHTTVHKGLKKFIPAYLPHSALWVALWRILRGLSEKSDTGHPAWSRFRVWRNRSELLEGLRSSNHTFSVWWLRGIKSVHQCGNLHL